MNFSERYGYVKPSEVLKREILDKEGETALCNCFDHLSMWLNRYDLNSHYGSSDSSYAQLEETIWCFFMNQRRNDFYGYNNHKVKVVATEFLLSDKHEWYQKFDMIEFAISILRRSNQKDMNFQLIVGKFVQILNATFKRINYAYRVVNDQIVEITDKEEMASIEDAIKNHSAVKVHLSNALAHLSSRPTPDYRNSIKESVSAIESLCREITGEPTLGSALKTLEKKGIVIPTFLRSGFEKLYVYTNDSRTGIRHALMNDAEVPQFDEAKFMLVSCSAFVNYIQGKRSTLKK